VPIEWTNVGGGIEVATAPTAVVFFEALRPSNLHWWEGDSRPWIFRGHALEDWQLLPSAWRPGNQLMQACSAKAAHRFDVVQPAQSLRWAWGNFISAAAEFGANDEALARELAIQTTAEYLPVWEFTARCDELGMPVPLWNPGPDPTQNENWLAGGGTDPLIADELLRFTDLPATLALAQHHGIPTRFLDWTRNPTAAAFFAVEDLVPSAGANLVVWALHRGRAKGLSVEGVNFPNAPHGAPRTDPQLEIVRPLTRDNPYLARQAGLFTTIVGSGIYFMQTEGVRPSVETFVAQANPPGIVLRKLILAHEHAVDLYHTLVRENISRSTLMPTMDNVAKDVSKWLMR
jgi:hypothetical protein